MIIENIDFPKDVKNLSIDKLNILAKEIREFIIETTSRTGGHVASNLGAVDIVIAIAYVFDLPMDKVIWDVGHQAYAHKIITGRKKALHTLRQFGGISGFLKRDESIFDTFGAGHASTAISSALGLSVARDLSGENYKVIAVVGDGALTGGMAMEGLNQAGHLQKDIIIILNDNKMSISPNVGGMKNYLLRLQSAPIYNKLKDDIYDLLGRLPSSISVKARSSARKLREGLKSLIVPNLLFEELGIRYFGPIDGHNLQELITTLTRLKNLTGPLLLHVITTKGKGYPPAEKDPTLFHGLGPYDIATGLPKKKSGPPSYSKVFGRTLTDFAKKYKNIVAITAAMPEGTGLDIFRAEIPERFFDVGIAEQHAVTFAAGLSTNSKRPVCGIYSTFLQRALDQIIHDVALQNLPVIFALDRGGLVSGDGATHHGAFDLTYLRMIPNMVVMAPKDEDELRKMILTAILYKDGPIAFRYPRGSGYGVKMSEPINPIEIGTWEVLKRGNDLAILAVGKMVYRALKIANLLKGIKTTVINARFVKPLDEKMLLEISNNHKYIVTIEDNILMGGFGSAILEFLSNNKINKDILRLGIPDRFIEHGNTELLFESIGLSVDKMAKRIREFLK